MTMMTTKIIPLVLLLLLLLLLLVKSNLLPITDDDVAVRWPYRPGFAPQRTMGGIIGQNGWFYHLAAGGNELFHFL